MQTDFYLYWDTSAIVSRMIQDKHTEDSKSAGNLKGVHFISSLGVAEVLGALPRIDPANATVLKDQFVKSIENGFWNLELASPSCPTLINLSNRCPLRGADLWHLAKALELREEIPELKIITFDEALVRACRKEELLFETGA